MQNSLQDLFSYFKFLVRLAGNCNYPCYFLPCLAIMMALMNSLLCLQKVEPFNHHHVFKQKFRCNWLVVLP